MSTVLGTFGTEPPDPGNAMATIAPATRSPTGHMSLQIT
jgi:hypothetical protein